MREIKFKAWLKDEQKMVNVASIDFRIEEIAYVEQRTIDNIQHAWYEYRDFNEIELLEYTGFKDKNGKKIFEGNIVVTPTRKGRVQFIWKGWYFHTTTNSFVELHNVTNIIEIIGNVYENPELLEAKNE
jgi:uncharacterized phage protein (TIGR01671 family)